MFSKAVKIMVLISDVQNHIPIKLCKTAGSIHLFKITGMLRAENIKLNKNYIWDTLEIDWEEVTVTFNDNKINLPRVVTIKLQDKIKVRHLIRENFTFPPNAETKNYVVHFGYRETRDCINDTTR